MTLSKEQLVQAFNATTTAMLFWTEQANNTNNESEKREFLSHRESFRPLLEQLSEQLGVDK